MSIKEQLSSNISGHWDFRRGTIADQSGNGNDGSFSGSPPWRNTSKGKSLEFQSTNIVTVSDSVELQATNMSVIIFGDFQEQTSGARFFSKRDAGGTHIDFFNFSASNLGVFDGTSTSDLAADIINVRMIGFTLTSGSTPEFFLNGVKEGNGDVAITISANDAPIAIGNFYTGNNPALNKFNEVLYFNTALTEQQMSELYNEWLQEAHLEHIPRTIVIPESVNVDANLQLALDMSSISGETMLDLSGEDNDGTISGAVPTQGSLGPAMRFDGVDDTIDCGDIENMDGQSALTIMGFVTSDDLNTFDAILTKGGGSPRIFFGLSSAAGFGGPDDYHFAVNSGGNAWTTGDLLTNGVPFHFAMVFDGSGVTDADKFKLYHNAESQTVSFSGVQPTVTASNASSVIIGRDPASGARFWDGTMEYIEVYNRVLTQAEVEADYAKAQKKVDLNYTGEDWEVSDADVTAGFLENTPWEVVAGNWQVEDSDNESKQFTAKANGSILSIPCDLAFGTFEFELNKALDAGDTYVQFIASEKDDVLGASNTGYYLQFSPTEQVVLTRMNGGTVTGLMVSAASEISLNNWYKITVTRNSDGEFSVYNQDITGGGSPALVTANTGSNPVTNTTHVSSSFCNFEFDNGDAIRNIRFYPTVKDPTA